MGRFDVLKQVRKPESESPASSPTRDIAEPPTLSPAPNSKRGSPQYRQFSAYLRADLYKKLKIKVAERDMDLSDAINEAVQMWVKEAGPANP